MTRGLEGVKWRRRRRRNLKTGLDGDMDMDHVILLPEEDGGEVFWTRKELSNGSVSN